ncbi:fungal-specific transcription factor domain-containing protein [Cunninghamella echinulata]|nr:fungal-specific transcription factor domain-containing protein [Cunninghamella echinulata]
MAEENPTKRQRVSKACEQCRKKKVKCLGSPPTCNNCKSLGLNCQYLESTKKRGPPKGYIEAIEGRLQRLEALLGSIIEDDDPRSQAILAELNAPLETANGELVRPRPLHHTSLHGLESELTSMMHMKNEGIDHENKTHNTPYHYDIPNQQQQHHQQQQQQEQQEQQNADMTSRSDQLDNLSIDDSGQLRYYGRSSGFDMLHRNKNLKNGSIHFRSRDTKLKTSSFKDNDKDGENNDHHNNSTHNKDNQNKNNQNNKKRSNSSTGDNNNNSKASIINITNASNIDPFELPPDDLSEHLLDLYFKTFYPWLPVIHKDSFLERMKSKDNKPPALLLNAIYGVTSRLSPDVRVRSDPQLSDTAGDIFFERARLLMELEWDDFKVYTVQALVLMSSHSNGALKTIRGWLYSGMAFRMAQNLGLHRNCDNWNLTDVEKEERKRCFYSCFVVDRLSCAMHGRSPVLDERDYDALYPSYEDKDDGNGESKNIMERFHQLIKLCELLGDVLRDLYMVRGRKQLSMMTCPDSVVANLDRGLNKWMMKLPQSMQYRPPNTRLAETGKAPALQLCQMHMLFYTILILLHRPFIPGSSSSPAPSVFPSAAICTFAANKILDISESLLADGRLKYVNNYALYFMFTAGIIFIHNAQSSDSMFSFEAKISINKIMHAMDEVENTWSTSARHCNILGALAGLRDIDLECVDESYSKSQNSVQNAMPPPLSIAVPNSPEEYEDTNEEINDDGTNSINNNDDNRVDNHEDNGNRNENNYSVHEIKNESESIPITIPTTNSTITSAHTSINQPPLSSSIGIDEKYANYYMGLTISTANTQQIYSLTNTTPTPTSPLSLQQQQHSTMSSLPISTSQNPSIFNATNPLPSSSSSVSPPPSASFPPHTLNNNDKSQVSFNPNDTAFWEIPSSINIQEWNSYLTDQAQKIDPLMMPPIVENDESQPKPAIHSQESPSLS